VDLDVSLASIAAYGAPGALDRLKEHLDPTWVEDALTWSGTTSIRRRRLPADQVVWLVIGMALYRNEPIEHIVDMLDLALPDKKDTLVAKSAIAQARRRLTEEPLAYLFATTAAEWAKRSADAQKWRGLSLYGLDGTTIRVPDSPENRAAFGGAYAGAPRGESGYPLVRAVAVMALRSHVMSAFRFADYATGETTLARDVWSEVPEDSLVIVDRNFLVANELIHLESSGNRHWLSRAKTRTRYAVVEKLGADDELVVVEVRQSGLPRQWFMRAIHYQVKGHPRSTLLTSLTDSEMYPAKELVELYHERWEAEIAYDEVKTHLLEREEAIRSRTPDGVRQELWGIAIAYNLVRLEMERVAAEAGVPPTRISFVAAIALVRDEIGRLYGRRLALGTIPARLQHLRRNLKRLVLPPRRPERSFPRAVKIKMSNYPRKRPTPRRPK
jgi:transposase IS4-like protein/DDE family transposase